MLLHQRFQFFSGSQDPFAKQPQVALAWIVIDQADISHFKVSLRSSSQVSDNPAAPAP